MKFLKKGVMVFAASLIFIGMSMGCANKNAQSDTVKWFTACNAILAEINNFDYMLYGGMQVTEENQMLQREVLRAAWDIVDRESADQKLEWLMDAGERKTFKEEMQFLDSVGLNEIEGENETEKKNGQIERLVNLFGMDESVAKQYIYEYEIYNTFGNRSVDGWDYCRALSVAGFCYVAGYYTKEEALDKSLEIAQKVQILYSSWDDLYESYFRGYEYSTQTSSRERRNIYEKLKTKNKNPYEVDFKTNLNKTW